MYAARKRIYTNTKDETYLINAVLKKYITAAQKTEIITTVA